MENFDFAIVNEGAIAEAAFGIRVKEFMLLNDTANSLMNFARPLTNDKKHAKTVVAYTMVMHDIFKRQKECVEKIESIMKNEECLDNYDQKKQFVDNIKTIMECEEKAFDILKNILGGLSDD